MGDTFTSSQKTEGSKQPLSSNIAVRAITACLASYLAFPILVVAIICSSLYLPRLPGLQIALAVLLGASAAFNLIKRHLIKINRGFDFTIASINKNKAVGVNELDKLITQSSSNHEVIKHLEQEVFTATERYDLLTGNLAASVVIISPENETLFCSPYSEVLTGYSLEELYHGGADFLDNLVLEQELPRYKRAKHISQLGEDIVVRYQIRHRSGITLWIESHLVPLCDDEGNVVSTMSVSIDVTASVRYQQRIEEQNRDLNDFTYMVSHDLKAPVFTIKGMASLLLEDYESKLDQDATNSIKHIIDAGDRLETLIKSVIEYSSLSTKDIEENDVLLQPVIENVVKDFKRQIEDAKAQINIENELPTVLGEENRFYQVFSNLLGNAIKYRSSARPLAINIRTKQNNDESVQIEITDNGLGIPADKIKDIFRPYHRAHGNDIEGSGVGLACVKKIVDRLGGGISVTSLEGKGSTFTLALRCPFIPQNKLKLLKNGSTADIGGNALGSNK